MITAEITNRIDSILDTFWTGAITILEQMTHLKGFLGFLGPLGPLGNPRPPRPS